jgi:hypothetical protein
MVQSLIKTVVGNAERPYRFKEEIWLQFSPVSRSTSLIARTLLVEQLAIGGIGTRIYICKALIKAFLVQINRIFANRVY